MKRRYFSTLAFFLAGLLTLISGILGNIATSSLPTFLKPYLWIAWPLVFLFAFLGLGFELWQRRLEKEEKPTNEKDANNENYIGSESDKNNLVISNNKIFGCSNLFKIMVNKAKIQQNTILGRDNKLEVSDHSKQTSKKGKEK